MDNFFDPGSLTSVLGELMKNPELGNMVNELKSRLAASNTADGGSVGADQSTSPADNTSSVASTSSAESTSPSENTAHQADNAPSGFSVPPDIIEKLPGIMSALGGKGAPKRNGSDNMARLLRALKPYLSGRRKDAIDSIIAVAELGSLTNLIPPTKHGE